MNTKIKNEKSGTIQTRHQGMMIAMIGGFKADEVAKMFDCSVDTVRKVARGPLFIAQLEEMRKAILDKSLANTVDGFDIRKYARAYSQEAFHTHVNLMRGSKKEEVQQRSATEILDRAEGKVGRRLEIKTTAPVHLIYTDEDGNEFREFGESTSTNGNVESNREHEEREQEEDSPNSSTD